MQECLILRFEFSISYFLGFFCCCFVLFLNFRMVRVRDRDKVRVGVCISFRSCLTVVHRTMNSPSHC